MRKIKIGQGYAKCGMGKTVSPLPVVWWIDGKAYVKDKSGYEADSDPLQGELKGYVRVNREPMREVFYKVAAGQKHNDYTQNGILAHFYNREEAAQ